jgi:O-6-methylguanine DNA methyltransferase
VTAPRQRGKQAAATPVAWTVIPSPLGDLLVTASENGLALVSFLDREGPLPHLEALTARGFTTATPPGPGAVSLRDRAATQLREYFLDRLREFDLPLDLRGTPFQEKVWKCLAGIPFGETWSYGQLALAIGRPGADRAVGAANGRNPLAVVLPCHRVVGSDGSLTGYGGGLHRKRWLLDHERTDLLPFPREDNANG